MPYSCQEELKGLSDCVASAGAACACFGGSPDAFADGVDAGTKTAIALEIPGTTAFCEEANQKVREFVEETAACCCLDEVTAYNECYFEQELALYGDYDCAYSSEASSTRGAVNLGDVLKGSLVTVILFIVSFAAIVLGVFFGIRHVRRKRKEEKDMATLEQSVAEGLAFEPEPEDAASFPLVLVQ